MGCGVSKPKIEGEDNQPQDPPGVSPIRRRIEEIKRVRNTRIYQKRCKSTLSEKQLLQSDNVGEEEHIPEDSLHDEEDRKSVSFPTERIGSDEANVLKSVDKRDIVRLENREEVQKKEDEEDEEEEEEEEEDQESTFGDGEEESELFPRSPSFRDYCVVSVGNSVDLFDTCKDDGNCGEEKRETYRRKESITSLNSSEGSVVVLVKKEHKVRRFRKVLPKGGQVAVKNLLNVKSCYIPSCSNPHGSSHSLLNEKSHTKSS